MVERVDKCTGEYLKRGVVVVVHSFEANWEQRLLRFVAALINRVN